MNENLKKFAAATNNELFDPDYKGGTWMVEAVKTRKTIEQFGKSSSKWSDRIGEQRGTIGGFPFVSWKSVKVSGGRPRRAMSVVDLGDVRYALEADLSRF